MFLIRRILTASLLASIAATASATPPIQHLKDGFYARAGGRAHLCHSFEVPKAKDMDSQNTLDVTGLYRFHLENGERRVQSDLDPDCEFAETNTREDLADRTELARRNMEICGGKVKSDITARLTIRPDRLHIDFEDKAYPSYSCDWVRSDNGRGRTRAD